MADTWTPISGYTPQEYTDTAIFEVDPDTKKIALIRGQALVAGEENSQYMKFLMPRYWDGIDIKDKDFYVEYALAGTYYGKTAMVNAEYNDEKVRFGWVVPKEACCISGTLFFVLRIESTEYVLKTQIAEHPVFKTINVEDVVPEPTREAWYKEFEARVEVAIDDAESALEQAQQAVVSAETAAQSAQTAQDNAEAAAASAQVRYGSPLVAQTVAEMVDENRVYVYVGSESGYTNGNWYYYDGSTWTSGGVYNSSAVNTDTTLTQSGMAADAKATGDKINSIVNSAYVTDSASGSVAHFTDGADSIPMKSLKVNIVPVQSGSGDPSPSNVRPITGRNNVKVTRAGKNLLVYPYSTVDRTTRNGITFEVHKTVDGRVDYVSASGTATEWAYFNFNTWGHQKTNAKSLVGKTLKLTGCPKLGNDNKASIIFQYRRSGSQQSIELAKDFGEGSNEFSVPSDMDSWAIFIQIEEGAQVDDARFYPMLRLASDTDDYEPYNGETYDISLASAGTVYGGTLDVVGGELTVDRKSVLVDGTQDIRASQMKRFFVSIADAREITIENQGTDASVISERFKSYTWSGLAQATGCAPVYGFGVAFRDPAITTVSEWKEFFQNNPTRFVYMLATPVTYSLTPTEVKTLLGINNIWPDAGDVTAEYRADTKLYIKRLTDSDTDMIADSNIVSGQYFMVGNDLYKATVNIASGAQIVVGTNATKVSLSEALNEINA